MAGLLFVAAQSLIKYNNPAKITTDYMHISKIAAYDYFLIFKSSSRGLLFVAAQSLADEQQKNGPSWPFLLLSTLYSLLSTLYSLLSTLYSLLSTLYFFHPITNLKCWCRALHAPYNKLFGSKRPNV